MEGYALCDLRTYEQKTKTQTNKQKCYEIFLFFFFKTWEQTQEWKWYGHAAIKRSGGEGKKL